MKFLIHIPLSFVIVMSLFACKKIEKETIEVTLASNNLYKYDFGVFPGGQGVEKKKEAQFGTISKIVNIGNDSLQYQYFPFEDYRGEDEVIFDIEGGSSATNDGQKKRLTIRFLIK